MPPEPPRARPRRGGAPALPQASGRRHPAARRALTRLRPWLLLSPALTVIGALRLSPLGRVGWQSVQDYRLANVVSELLRGVGLLGPDGHNWSTDRAAFYAIVALNLVHHGFPFVAVTVLAGLLTIPRELTEAAMLDGANAWQRFRHITVPTLRPVFAVVTVLSTIWDPKVFAQVYLMPGGSGANPEVLNLGVWSYIVWSYIRSFGQQDYGLGSAVAVLLTLILLAVTLGYLRLLFREEELR